MMKIAMVVMVVGIATQVMAAQATLTIDASKVGPRISPSLYGLFFEEINHAGDGGLYAEMLRNRNFADGTEGWSLFSEGAAEGTMTAATDEPNAIKLSVTKGGGRVGLASDGYFGLPVRKGARYTVTVRARGEDGFDGTLNVSLEHAAGEVYAEGKIGPLGAAWKKYTVVLTPTASGQARLILAALKSGTVRFGFVSMMPETWKGRPNGLRADLAEMLAGMKPSFVRFPGGCFVEGNKMANAFRWKTTIGDVMGRPGHWNLWGYRSTDGLGLHEYLQMCEDLGAEPLFVINCGMAHEDVVPMEKMDEFVQDALDAIEYANGPATSKWGAIRAANGHPAPFGMKMMEIGNENGGPNYEERYALFYKAIKAKYPQMQLVANAPVKSAPMDILDEHYYSSPTWFASQAHRYDKYDRAGPKIYVGEYACTQDCGQGNLMAALGEAAFMTGMERNSDIVAMASYAPLFVNVNNRAWSPDLIGYNASTCYGIPSYYAQRMFGENRGEAVVASEVECAQQTTKVAGGIGLATWVTQAEFKDIKVTRGGETLYASDFSTGAPGWRAVKGDWKVQDGAYRQRSLDTGPLAMAGDVGWSDYTYSLKARKISGGEGFLIMFGARSEGDWYWWNLGGWGNVRHQIEKCQGGAKMLVGDGVPGRIETGRWYDIRIEVNGARIRCYLDGKLIHDVEDQTFPVMCAVASRTRGGEIIAKIVNLSETAQDTTVRIDGAKAPMDGTVTVLTSGRPTDENSLGEPTKVAPVTTTLKGVGAEFRHTFPAYSLTVMRLKGGYRRGEWGSWRRTARRPSAT